MSYELITSPGVVEVLFNNHPIGTVGQKPHSDFPHNILNNRELQSAAERLVEVHKQRHGAVQQTIVDTPEFKLTADLKDVKGLTQFSLWTEYPSARNDRIPHKLVSLHLEREQVVTLGEFLKEAI